MRIANKTVYDNIKVNLNRVSTDMFKTNTVVSTGKRINNLSDDPVGLVNVLDLRASIANIEQFGRNITMGKSWLVTGESTLSQMEDVLTGARTLCVEMVNGTKGATERANAATLVDGYLKQIMSLANTQVGGRYIFAGTDTETMPFTFDDESNPTEVAYSGNSAAFTIRIGRSLAVDVGRDGETIFGDDDCDWSNPADGHDNIFKTMIDLKTSLLLNDVPGIEEAMDKLDGHSENVRNLTSDTGAKMIRMNVREDIIKDLSLTYTDRMSQLEDADIAEAIIDLNTKELAYQAALSSSSKLMTMSLIDYL